MRNFKFDLAVILRNCERFAVKVEKSERLHGVTMNGEEFDVREVIDSAFEPSENNSLENLSLDFTMIFTR